MEGKKKRDTHEGGVKPVLDINDYLYWLIN